MDTLVSLAGRFPLPGLVRDLHPLDDTHAGQTEKIPLPDSGSGIFRIGPGPNGLPRIKQKAQDLGLCFYNNE